MEKVANHLLSSINDVLQVSKLEQDIEEFSSESVCLIAVFNDVKAIIQGNALENGISLKFSGDTVFVPNIESIIMAMK